MSASKSTPLTERMCEACEGGVDKLTGDQTSRMLAQVPSWELTEGGDSIQRKWKFKNFVEAIAFINRVGELAEAEQHHPDLHLTGYRQVRVELTTHAIGGLSDNDFIVAAKLNAMSA